MRSIDHEEPGKATEDAAGPAAEKGLWYYLGVALSGALLLAVIGIAALAIVVPAVVGGSALTVLTQSMEPGLPPGTLIIIRPVDARDVGIGDVITYQLESGKPAVVSHRVIERRVSTAGEVTFITKGDNNDLVDPTPVATVQIKGELWYAIPYLGYLNNLLDPQTRSWLVPALAIGLFGYAGYLVISSLRERKQSGDRSSGDEN